ncbi:MAG: hypothetical protein E2603_04225, partial [Achromobacter sp.]|nr:hypothetical protein [Achromobacter sp.]
MKKSIYSCAGLFLSGFCLCATAQTVTPLKGQTPQVTQQDISQCQAMSGSTSSTSADNNPQAGGRVRGAAAGAAAGAA